MKIVGDQSIRLTPFFAFLTGLQGLSDEGPGGASGFIFSSAISSFLL